MNDSMKVLYLTWGEVIVGSGIFANQVQEQLGHIKKIDPDIDITVVSGIPAVNMKILRTPVLFMNSIKKTVAAFQKLGINFIPRYIAAPSSWFYSTVNQLPWYGRGHINYLKKLIVNNKIDIVHCRSYHAAFIACKTKKSSRLPFKIVFDTRGLFPEEGIFMNRYSQTSRHYQNWKNIERELLLECDSIVNVSSPFSRYVASIAQCADRITTIPVSVNLDIFSIADHVTRQSIRQEKGVAADEKVLVYLGDINHTSWHRIDTLAELYAAFKSAFIKTKMLFITRSNQAIIKESFAKKGVSETDIIICQAYSPSETNSLLQIGDFAALPFKRPENEIERIVGDTMLASKTGEYLAAGLPLLVNSAIGAASEVAVDGKAGIIYDVGKEQKLVAELRMSMAQYDQMRQRCPLVADAVFSSKRHGQDYVMLYKKLLAGLNH